MAHLHIFNPGKQAVSSYRAINSWTSAVRIMPCMLQQVACIHVKTLLAHSRIPQTTKTAVLHTVRLLCEVDV